MTHRRGFKPARSSVDLASYEDALAFVQVNFPEEIPTLTDLAEKARTED